MYVSGDIVIKSGATLTVKSTLYMAPDAKILVEIGGQLTVNGGTITNACDNLPWKGIEVRGNENAQTLANQGKVTLTNATISNSDCAIFLYYGAMLTASNTKFINNKTSLSSFEYPNTNSNQLTQCSFTWNNNLIITDVSSLNHVSMWQIYGIKFLGCTFNNEITSYTVETSGINTDESGFIVDSSYTINLNPISSGFTTTKVPAKFTNLTFGIQNYGGGNNLCSVTKSTFKNNMYGILITSCNNFSATNNTFNIPPQTNGYVFIHTDSRPSQALGITLQNCHGFTVKNNDFTGNGTNNYTVGIQVENNYGYNDTVSNNKFTKLYAGTQALGYNGKSGTKGLLYKCNKFLNSTFGIFVSGYTKLQNSNNATQGICQRQGISSKPITNDFSGSDYALANFHANSITYCHNVNENSFVTVGDITVTTTLTTAANCGTIGCPTSPIIPLLEPNVSSNRENDLSLNAAEDFLFNKDYTQAKKILDRLDNNGKNTDDEISDLREYIACLEKYQNRHNIPDDILLKYESHKTKVGQYARDILSFKGIKHYYPTVARVDIKENEDNKKSSQQFATDKNTITLSPNPAKDMVTVIYNIDDSDCDFVLYNSNGNEILRENLQGFNGEKSIILPNFASYAYYYKIIKDNIVIKSDKLIITK